jgi:hypothetical protein
MKHLALAAALLALPLAAHAQATGSWAQGVDCQADTVGSTLAPALNTDGTPILDANGNPTYTGSPGTPGYDCIVDLSVVAPMILSASVPVSALSYQVKPPLTRVYAGEDPAAPTHTLQFQFPDAATAQTVLSGLWTPAAPF